MWLLLYARFVVVVFRQNNGISFDTNDIILTEGCGVG